MGQEIRPLARTSTQWLATEPQTLHTASAPVPMQQFGFMAFLTLSPHAMTQNPTLIKIWVSVQVRVRCINCISRTQMHAMASQSARVASGGHHNGYSGETHIGAQSNVTTAAIRVHTTITNAGNVLPATPGGLEQQGCSSLVVALQQGLRVPDKHENSRKNPITTQDANLL